VSADAAAAVAQRSGWFAFHADQRISSFEKNPDRMGMPAIASDPTSIVR
jgi:hypothetical protein